MGGVRNSCHLWQFNLRIDLRWTELGRIWSAPCGEIWGIQHSEISDHSQNSAFNIATLENSQLG
jgi:hypothetical protein